MDASRRIALSYRHKLLDLAADNPELAAEVDTLDAFWSNLGAAGCSRLRHRYARTTGLPRHNSPSC